MGSVLAMGGARAQVVKRAPIVEKERPVKPWDVQLRDIWRKNKFACVSLAVLAVSWLAVLWFSRTNYIKSWAYSQGLTFDASYNYKLARGYTYFDAVRRGQKAYAFNVMKGNVDYKNKSASDAEERTTVKAFDFCYTEVKVSQHKSRVVRQDKQHEFSALVFDVPDYMFKSMIITPRDMEIETDQSDSRVEAADADTEELMKGPVKEKNDKLDDAKADGKSKVPSTSDKKDKKKAGEPKIAGGEKASEVPAVVAEKENKTATPSLNATHPFSFKFDEAFKIEATDHVQADGILSPELKQLLLDRPNFFVDFEEEQFMIYREYTIEPSEYSAALELGEAILSHLPSRLDVNATIKKDQDVSAFVSKREPAK